jgi:phosphate transport system substrate-binding protein
MSSLRRLSTLLAITAASGAFAADSIAIQGMGATFPAPLYSKWIDAFNKEHVDTKVDYQAQGSGAGIKAITDHTVQFAGSDAPMTESQLSAAPGILHLPTVAGPVVLITHHPKITAPLVLDGEIVADIYNGKITTWNDPKIVARNPGVVLPSDDIVVVHRSDGSGTTYIFTNYLSKVSAEWKKDVGNATSVKWPVGLGGKGNAGVAAAVVGSNSSIGYVELAYAKSDKTNSFTVCKMINHDGKVVEASIAGVNEAAKSSGEVPDDLRISITDAPGAGSYPICGFTYMLIYQDLSYLKNPAQAQHLIEFIHWCEHDGQSMASPDYASLSDSMRAKVDAKLKSVVVDGKPALSETSETGK